MAKIIDKFPTYNDFWNEYRKNFLGTKIDPIILASHTIISRDVYYYYRESNYSDNENAFYGQLFSKINTDSASYAKSQQIFTNLIEPLKLKDKDLFKVERTTEHSKENEKTTETPQTTDFVNIPFTQGENMEDGSTYGRAQILKQQKKELKTFTKEVTKGRRVTNEDGSVTYKDTYENEIIKGDKTWLGRLINALQHVKYDISEVVQSYYILFDIYCSPPSGYFVTLPSGKRKWIFHEDEDEEEDEILPSKSKKKKTTDIDDITWEEWVAICEKKEIIPNDENYYLELITRYRARKEKEKEKAPVSSLSALALDKQKELGDGLIKAWESSKTIPNLERFDAVMEGGEWNGKKYDGLLGFKEFKRKLRKYIVNLEDDMIQGKKTKQTINALLGPPGIGKSHICKVLSEAMGWPLVKVDLGGRSDTGIFEGVSPSTKAPFAGRLCEGLAKNKSRTVIFLLDEPDKIQGEGLRDMMGNVTDVEQNKEWRDLFLEYHVDLSHCIFIMAMNYKKGIPDFIFDRVTFIDLPIYTYEEREDYVVSALIKLLGSDEKTKRYAKQITKDFCKYIITEAWGLRQVNTNIDEIYKSLRYYVNMENRGREKAIEDLTKPFNIEITPTRFNLVYKDGQEINLNRVRTFSRVEDNLTKKEKIITVWTELEWPNHQFSTEPQLVETK